MNWLARLDVDMEAVRSEGIFNDIYSWHKGLWKCFPGEPDAKRDFLTRIDLFEGAFRFWVMAKREPVRPNWCPPDGFALKKISPSFLTHQYYAFDLQANPVRTIAQRDSRKSGKRVPLVEDDQLKAWLIKRGNIRCREDKTGDDVPGGFRIVEERPIEISPMVESHFRKIDRRNGKIHAAYHGGVQFRGVLEITDQNAFIQTYQSGIGSAKSFGFGLFLLAPIQL